MIKLPSRPNSANLPTFDVAPVFETPTPTPLGFNVAVKPRAPKTQIGLLATSKRTQEADQALETIGQILAIGEKAWSAGSGLDLSISNRPAVGDWVVYRQHAGQKMRLRKRHEDADPDGTTLSEFILVMTDTDILASFKSAADAGAFYAWL